MGGVICLLRAYITDLPSNIKHPASYILTINTFNTLNTIRMANRVALNKASERVCTFSLIVNVLINLL
jgi:hypothetical protein